MFEIIFEISDGDNYWDVSLTHFLVETWEKTHFIFEIWANHFLIIEIWASQYFTVEIWAKHYFILEIWDGFIIWYEFWDWNWVFPEIRDKVFFRLRSGISPIPHLICMYCFLYEHISAMVWETVLIYAQFVKNKYTLETKIEAFRYF